MSTSSPNLLQNFMEITQDFSTTVTSDALLHRQVFPAGDTKNDHSIHEIIPCQWETINTMAYSILDTICDRPMILHYLLLK